jgi:putative ABC transport system permease protein
MPNDSLGAALAADRRRASAAYDALLALLKDEPGVRGAGAVNPLPLTGNWWTTSLRLPEEATTDESMRLPVFERPVTPGYFEAMGTRVIQGRGIERSDVAGGTPVVVVDAELARRAWGDADPVGRDVVLDGPPNGPPPRARVVGVVESIHMNRLDDAVRPTMYVPLGQAHSGHYLNWGMDIVVRGAAPRAEPAIRDAVRQVFPDAAVFRVASMQEVVDQSMAGRRFQLVAIGLFAVLALVLATIGVGGALLLSVRERRSELAVRMVLGARPMSLWWHVQGGGLTLAGLGALVGIGGALAGARVFSSVVYGVSVRDPLSLAAGPVLMLFAAFVAAAIPATRAITVSPVAVLRE